MKMIDDTGDNLRAAKSKLWLRRRALDLQQTDLAARCGVSRQFLSLVESGRAQPNVQVALRLAAELGCSVEDIFGSVEARNPIAFAVQLAQPMLAAGTRLDIANVGGRWVAHAADTADSLGGGFSESDAVLAWMDGRAEAQPHRPIAELENNITIAGCDPALGLLRSGGSSTCGLGTIPLPGRCVWINCGSSRALQLLAQGWVHAAGLHYSGGDPDENLRQVRRLDPNGQWQVLHFTRWENGWMVRPEARKRFNGIADLSAKRIRLLNREPGSGSRHWLDAELSRANLHPGDVLGYGDELSSHWQCANALRAGRADVAIGPRAIAAAFGLEFIPTGEVAFDIVVPKAHLHHPSLQAILQRIRSRGFQREIETLAGYCAGDAGSRAD
jgi:molybdate-binding protein/DNA-binding XRE family transcriptional regulator